MEVCLKVLPRIFYNRRRVIIDFTKHSMKIKERFVFYLPPFYNDLKH